MSSTTTAEGCLATITPEDARRVFRGTLVWGQSASKSVPRNTLPASSVRAADAVRAELWIAAELPAPIHVEEVLLEPRRRESERDLHGLGRRHEGKRQR